VLLYFVKRIFLGFLIISVAVTLMFCMIHLVPGDPARIMLGPRATPEMIADISMRMGLDQPILIQLMKFFGNILQGNLGMDVISSRPVTAIVFGQLPYTLWLIFSAIFG
jgi:peptide/nickel transport system permease protein